MIDVPSVISVLLDVLLLPLQLVLAPIDMLLAQIPSVEEVPEALTAMVSFISTLPSTMVVLAGASPFLWNALFLVFLSYMGLAPAVNVLKRTWAWLRP